ncbi:hypothetical protein DFH08DRAFT_969018 [Mycena albidolilacea]|uniref:Uncharacterized protein n=1 Tax=Mycena albidolilacea TaxID=1033008 RepID=A0AAD6ZIM8_9AGAR|nr:hypothetical protein DFH08DRAFT_969018 [Mycena albidolilacea]
MAVNLIASLDPAQPIVVAAARFRFWYRAELTFQATTAPSHHLSFVLVLVISPTLHSSATSSHASCLTTSRGSDTRTPWGGHGFIPALPTPPPPSRLHRLLRPPLVHPHLELYLQLQAAPSPWPPAPHLVMPFARNDPGPRPSPTPLKHHHPLGPPRARLHPHADASPSCTSAYQYSRLRAGGLVLLGIRVCVPVVSSSLDLCSVPCFDASPSCTSTYQHSLLHAGSIVLLGSLSLPCPRTPPHPCLVYKRNPAASAAAHPRSAPILFVTTLPSTYISVFDPEYRSHRSLSNARHHLHR